jgi:O-6-methylguanine DNA methyltransferase
MDDLDARLAEYFSPALVPPGLAARIGRRGPRRRSEDVGRLVAGLRIEATDRGICRIRKDGGDGRATPRSRRLVEQARRQIAEYLTGRRVFFTVPVDLAGVPGFQARVLRETSRIGFGEVRSYAELARRVGHPQAARAVGNALGANPVPFIVPCHRVIRGDGTWGHYLFGGALKTRLLALERATPVLTGCTTTRIVCRRGCAHEQRVREDRRVVFASVPDARSVGYRPCRTCRPDAAS